MSRDPVGVYARRVVSGKIVAGTYVRQACQRHLDDLQRSKDADFPFRFDRETALDIILFCQTCCRHFEGRWAGQPFDPELWQEFIIGSLFGWLRKDTDLRRFRVAYARVARKNGKTLLVAAIGMYLLVLDGEPGAQIFTAATKREQAGIMFRAATSLWGASPSLRNRVQRFKLNLSVDETASYWRPLGRDAHTEDGLNPHGALVDEVHAHRTREMWDVLRSAQGAREQSLQIGIGTAGHNPGGAGAVLEEYFRAIVDPKSGVENEKAFVYIAQPDRGDDALAARDGKIDRRRARKAWRKANPNFGVSIREDELADLAQEALDDPSSRAEFLAKRACVWTAGTESFLTLDSWDACDGPPRVDPEALRGHRCIAGLDLSETRDLTALVLIFWELDPMAILPFFWVPAARVEAQVDEVDYELWVRAGYIEATPGAYVDYAAIEDRIVKLSQTYDFHEVAYDGHNATYLVQRLAGIHGIECVKVAQTCGSLNDATKGLERQVGIRGLVHGGHPVLRWQISNAGVRRDHRGQIMVEKGDGRQKKKVDGVAALTTGLSRVLVQDHNPAPPITSHVIPGGGGTRFGDLDGLGGGGGGGLPW